MIRLIVVILLLICFSIACGPSSSSDPTPPERPTRFVVVIRDQLTSWRYAETLRDTWTNRCYLVYHAPDAVSFGPEVECERPQ